MTRSADLRSHSTDRPSTPAGGGRRVGRARELIWAATVGLVLADSTVVTLALPEMLREFETTVLGVSWVLTALNLVLAVAVLSATRGWCGVKLWPRGSRRVPKLPRNVAICG